ncbi:MAG TPA: hypothetical protein PKE31_20100 [Pseudomonadota bacterium]|jgi:hypothetical protein|nr:hypothetical protein [Pseudomonadota bacterium]
MSFKQMLVGSLVGVSVGLLLLGEPPVVPGKGDGKPVKEAANETGTVSGTVQDKGSPKHKGETHVVLLDHMYFPSGPKY